MTVHRYRNEYHAANMARRIYDRWSPVHKNMLGCVAVPHPFDFGYAVMLTIDTAGDRVVQCYMRNPREYSPAALREFLAKKEAA